MKAEQNYDFRTRCCQLHNRIPGWKSAVANADEFVLTDGLSVSCTACGPVAQTALKDFIGYLKTAFGLSARCCEGAASVTLALDPAMTDYMARRMTVDAEGIRICAADERGLAQALYDLEDSMNLRRAPFVAFGTTEKKPAFSPRMTHSALGVDYFPDEYLSACAHHGFDAVLVFMRDARHAGPKNQEYDFNDLVTRAARYGIDVYAYSKIHNYVHPDEPNARETFDRAYGDVFRAIPGLKGMVFVGESIQFPSKDPAASPYPYPQQPADGIPDPRPRSGWWPCYDYVQWISMVRDSIRAASPDADVVFWSYNWGKQPKEPRIALLESLPLDISLLVTFEMFDNLDLGNSTGICADYSVAHVGPGQYFISEAEVAKRRGLRLYSMVNTAGRTWDFGVAPYEPFPWQWNDRHQQVLQARETYGLCGLMESHHYGFMPSFISAQAKQAFTVGGASFEEYITSWAKNLAGEDAYETLLEAMKLVDQGMKHYVPSNENQYGAFRIGPAYPFCLTAALKKPNTPQMYFGNGIYNVMNVHRDSKLIDPYSIRVWDELRLHRKALKFTRAGVRLLRTIPNKSVTLRRLIDLCQFIANCHQTAVNYKEFYIMRTRLLVCRKREDIYKLADRIEQLIRREMKNVEATIPLVQRNSDFGYEASMEYQCDEECLRWKLKQLDHVIFPELVPYRPKVK